MTGRPSPPAVVLAACEARQWMSNSSSTDWKTPCSCCQLASTLAWRSRIPLTVARNFSASASAAFRAASASATRASPPSRARPSRSRRGAPPPAPPRASRGGRAHRRARAAPRRVAAARRPSRARRFPSRSRAATLLERRRARAPRRRSPPAASGRPPPPAASGSTAGSARRRLGRVVRLAARVVRDSTCRCSGRASTSTAARRRPSSPSAARRRAAALTRPARRPPRRPSCRRTPRRRAPRRASRAPPCRATPPRCLPAVLRRLRRRVRRQPRGTGALARPLVRRRAAGRARSPPARRCGSAPLMIGPAGSSARPRRAAALAVRSGTGGAAGNCRRPTSSLSTAALRWPRASFVRARVGRGCAQRRRFHRACPRFTVRMSAPTYPYCRAARSAPPSIPDSSRFTPRARRGRRGPRPSSRCSPPRANGRDIGGR